MLKLDRLKLPVGQYIDEGRSGKSIDATKNATDVTGSKRPKV